MFSLRSLSLYFALILPIVVSTRSHAITIAVTTTNDNMTGCLRYAITNANATTAGANTITFNLPGPTYTINLTSPLPAIINPLTIDGTSQPGYVNAPLIELSGAGIVAGGAIGLQLNAGSSPSTVMGLAINNFNFEGIALNGASNVIQGNFIGTDPTGTYARGNSVAGISVASQGNLIGDTAAIARNIISGNGTGIILNGSGVTGNIIKGNYIGTDISGTTAIANNTNGIQLNLASANVIGPSNLISGNKLAGIFFSGNGANSNSVIGNYIGTEITGTTALGNTYAAVTISGALGNQIGGRNAGNGNVLSGNLQDGIFLTGGSSGTVVQGNLIGLSAAGTNAIANGYSGIDIAGSSSNSIGGLAISGARNFISGNTGYGVAIYQTNDTFNLVSGNYIGTDINGQRAVTNLLSGILVKGCSNTIGWSKGIGSGNVISGNGQLGIWLLGTNGSTRGNQVSGNIIGLDYTGTNILGNSQAGIEISGAATNQIGGTSSSTRNAISGNGYNGIFLLGAGTIGNVIQGNYIGTDSTGTLARGNIYDGIALQNVTNNQIGGTNASWTTLSAGNLISGNNANGLTSGNNGIYLTNSTQTIIQGNRIGTDASGTVGLANSWHGIYLDHSISNQIGGTIANTGNLISGNGRTGIFMSSSDEQIVQGNYIGTDISGNNAVANLLDGIQLYLNSCSNLIGGSLTGAANVISGNGNGAVYCSGASMNTIQGNLIGIAADGSSPLGNATHSVQFDIGSTNNILGGINAMEGNSIANTKRTSGISYAGVRIRNGAFNNLVSGNSIYNNAGLGIDLGNAGVNANISGETGVLATNANRLQNYPILSSAASGTIGTLIHGSFNSAPNISYSLEFFASPFGNTNGFGEGKIYLGHTNIALGTLISTNFSITLPVSMPTNWVITATATDSANNTSEFSNWITNIVTIPIPVAGLATYSRTAGLALIIPLTDLATNWSDASGYPIRLAAINFTTTNGVLLTPLNLAYNYDGSYTINSTAFLGYTNTSPNKNDQLSYTISDGYNTNVGLVNISVVGSITGQIKTITLTNGFASANFYGVLGWPYSIQRSTDLQNWVTVLTTNAPAGGLFQFTDSYSDLGGIAPATAYYRLFWQP